MDKLTDSLSSGTRPKLRGHDAIHLFLLVDTLWDDYTRAWEDRLPGALDKFLEALNTAKATRDAAQPNEFWLRYGQWTRVNSDRGDRISHRHEFYVSKMLEYMSPLKLKDSQRLFGPLEREIIYFRDQKKCAVCGGTVAWLDAEIHHIQEHAQGGPTDLENGVLVHGHCHPVAANTDLRINREPQRPEQLYEIVGQTDSGATRGLPDGHLHLGQGACLEVGEKIYLFLSEDQKRNDSPAAIAEVKDDGLYLFGEKIQPSKGSVIQPAMKLVQAKVDHRNQQGELVSLSAWRQWHVKKEGRYVPLFDLKNPTQARTRRSTST